MTLSLLWASVGPLDVPQGFSGQSTVRRWLDGTPPWGPMRARTYTARLVRDSGGIALDPRPPQPQSITTPAGILTIRYAPVDEASGFLAITRLHRRHRFEVTGAEAFSPDELRLARLVFFDEVARPFSALSTDTLRRLPGGDFEEDTIVWSGYGRDAWILLMAGLFVVSLAWVPAWARESREDSRRKRGLCPGCGYSRTGLGEGPCPECGRGV